MKLLFFYIFTLCSAGVLSSNLTYTDIPQESYNEVTIEISVVSLEQLFIMTKQFIDIVFRPFTAIEEFIYNLIVGGNGDFFTVLLDDWQTLATYEVGFITCLVAGCLFIIFVPLVGIIMCCCRTCCSNCGGEMIQSKRRVGSKWRHCFCVSLLIISVLMAIPCVFVFLTNEWTTQVVKIVPQKTSDTLDTITRYIDSIPGQLDHIVVEYGKLDESLTNDVQDLGTVLGIPVRDTFISLATPSLNKLTKLSNDTKDASVALNSVQNNTSTLDGGITQLNTQLVNEKTSLDADLNDPACDGNLYCVLVQRSTALLDPTGADFSSLQDVTSEIASINNILTTYDIDAEVAKVMNQLNDIPELVTNSSADATQSLMQTLNDVNKTLVDSVQNIPMDAINNFKSEVSKLNNTIISVSTTYSQYDIYRYAAGVVLASIVALIVVLYLIGTLMGTCSFKADRDPSQRSTSSNCGGILIMSGVGFSFIFAWLLMILVTVAFTVGGHGERYGCQNFEKPYEGLKFADRVLEGLSIGVAGSLGNSEANISVYEILIECENNASIYTALRLEYLFNITEIVQNSTNQLASFKTNLENLTVDLSSIVVYTQEINDSLAALKTTGLDGIDFASYIAQIDQGLTQTDLNTYAEFLNESATNMSTPTPSLALQAVIDKIRKHSYDITIINQLFYDPLAPALTELNSSILMLQSLTSGLNATIDATDAELQALDQNIKVNGSIYVKTLTENYADSLIGDVTGYTDWLLVQITDNLGKCRPIYLAYTQVISLLCDYFMDVLNGLWFSLGWCVFFLIPGAILGMKVAKFYRRMNDYDEYNDTHWNEMEMDAFNRSNNNGNSRTSSKFRSAKIHPGQYY